MNKRAKIQFWLEFSTDLICLILANLIAFLFFRFIVVKIMDYPLVSWIRFYSNIDIHKRNRSAEMISVLKNGIFTYLVFSALILLVKNPINDSRYMMFASLILFIGFTTVSRYFLKRFITREFTTSRIASLVGIITTSDVAEDFVKGIKEDWSISVSGIVLLDNYCENGVFKYESLTKEANSASEISSVLTDKKAVFEKDVCDVPVISTDESFMEWIRSAPLDEVFINVNYQNAMEVHPIVEELEDMGITVHLNIPTLVEMLDESKFDNINCKTYSGFPMATFSAAKTYGSSWLVAKRLFDIIMGIIGCIISAPIILITAIPLLRESPGPLFFKQLRVGKNGRLFYIYKLRSMYVDAEERKA